MGKFRAKPARLLSNKSLRKKSKSLPTLEHLGEPAVSTTPSRSPLVPSLSSSKIQKRPKPLLKRSGVSSTNSTGSLPEGDGPSQKKSVTFSSSNTVHHFTPNLNKKKESIQEILKEGAGAIVNLVTAGFKKASASSSGGGKSKDSYKLPVPKRTLTNAASLNKIIRNEFKDKRTRRMLRREAFQKKLSLLKAAEEEKKAEKKRKETVVVGDMLPLSQLLEEMEDDEKKRQELQKKRKEELANRMSKQKKKKSKEKRDAEMLEALQILDRAATL